MIVLSARIDAGQSARAGHRRRRYVTKPFGIAELLARMRAAVRRSTQGTGPDDANAAIPDDAVVGTAAFTIDLAAKKVIRQGDELRLTRPNGRSSTSCETPRRAGHPRPLLTAVWGPNYHQTNYLRVYLAQLRRKLEPEPSRPRYLITEPAWATASKGHSTPLPASTEDRMLARARPPCRR